MFGKLFKPRAHYVFDYKPRYYNERKERIQKLEDQYHGKATVETDKKPLTFQLSKSELRNEWKRNKGVTSDKKTTLRLAIIIAILVGFAAYILQLHTLF